MLYDTCILHPRRITDNTIHSWTIEIDRDSTVNKIRKLLILRKIKIGTKEIKHKLCHYIRIRLLC
jgi:hypothetical protein